MPRRPSWCDALQQDIEAAAGFELKQKLSVVGKRPLAEQLYAASHGSLGVGFPGQSLAPVLHASVSSHILGKSGVVANEYFTKADR